MTPQAMRAPKANTWPIWSASWNANIIWWREGGRERKINGGFCWCAHTLECPNNGLDSAQYGTLRLVVQGNKWEWYIASLPLSATEWIDRKVCEHSCTQTNQTTNQTLTGRENVQMWELLLWTHCHSLSVERVRECVRENRTDCANEFSSSSSLARTVSLCTQKQLLSQCWWIAHCAQWKEIPERMQHLH